MRLATLLSRTLREAPADAEHMSHQLILRAGLARAIAPGCFALLPLGLAAVRRIETIIRDELVRLGGQEVRLPIVQPATRWEQIGRNIDDNPPMLRNDRALVFAPNHAADLADLARLTIRSYRQLPALVFAIQPTYRDEPRMHGGLLHSREFTLLTVCAFDADPAAHDATFAEVDAAFARIFTRCGVSWTGAATGVNTPDERAARAYVALAPFGEDTFVHCRTCGDMASSEVAVASRPAPSSPTDAPPPEMVATPGAATIADLAAFLGINAAATAKAVFFDTPERGLLFVVIRGDLEVNEARLRAVAGVSRLLPAKSEQIAATGAVPGYASPVGLQGAAMTVIADTSVVEAGPLVAGANREGCHLRNVVYGRDWQADLVADIAAVRAGDLCKRCGAPLDLERGVTLGRLVQMAPHYAADLGATFLNEQGASQPLLLSVGAIGIERLLQIIIEQRHDARGIIWPVEVAPADVHIIVLGKSPAVQAEAARLHDELTAVGLRPLLDDRDESAGVKFNDADLIGLPLRLVLSEKLLATGEVELKPRSGEPFRVARDEAVRAVKDKI